MLEKRFTPSWLAGTSIGELMFQADYYLKELSMGESPCSISVKTRLVHVVSSRPDVICMPGTTCP